MTTRGMRLGLVATVSAFALAVTGQAVAAVSPSLSVSTSAAGSVISYTQGATDDPAAQISFYVPSGFTALLAQPEGEVVGRVAARASAADLGNAQLPLAGTINAALATTTITFAGATVPLSTLSVACTGTATHTAFWIFNLTASGQTLQVPAYVDDIPLGIPLGDLANNRITVCLPPPDVPAGTPGRATFGAKLQSVTMTSTVFSVPPASYTWRATVTPYTPGTGRANPAGTVEAQSVDRTPQQVRLTARAVAGRPRTVQVTGRVLAGERGVSGASVSVTVGTRVLARVRTRAAGVYTARIRIPTATARLRATATFGSTSAGSCTPSFPPVPCSSRSFGAFVATSPLLRVRA